MRPPRELDSPLSFLPPAPMAHAPDLSALLADASIADDASGALPFVNAQLVAHGFAQGAGLRTDGLDADASARLAKCLLGMLGQRSVRMLLA
jgi:hypothetical protein